MKFGQLIRYKVRNIFHEKSYRKYGKESNLGPFLKTGQFLDQRSESLYCVFVVCTSQGLPMKLRS